MSSLVVFEQWYNVYVLTSFGHLELMGDVRIENGVMICVPMNKITSSGLSIMETTFPNTIESFIVPPSNLHLTRPLYE